MKEIFFKKMYNGGVEIRARDKEGNIYVIENAIDILMDAVDGRGYTLKLSPRQQYQRLTINK